MKPEDGLRVKGFEDSLDVPVQSAEPSTLRPFNSPTDGVSKWPHRLAVITASATFPLLFIGGLVTSKGAALAVPDWPTTYGYNMFTYPWSQMVGGIFYEHSHRLVASGVGLLTVALALLLWFRERRNWVRRLGLVALGLIVLQGVIGGLRVVLLEQTLAIIHACLAQAFFGLIVSLTIFTSKLWSDESTISVQSDGGRLLRLCTFTTALIYFQAISGAIVRHTGERLDAHLVVAALVLIHVMLVVARVMRFHSDQTKLVGPAMCLGGLLLLQLTLGLGSYLSKFTSVAGFTAWGVVTVTTTHLVTGALMLVTALLLSSRCYLLSPDRKSLTTQAQLTEQFSV